MVPLVVAVVRPLVWAVLLTWMRPAFRVDALLAVVDVVAAEEKALVREILLAVDDVDPVRRALHALVLARAAAAVVAVQSTNPRAGVTVRS